MIALVIALMSGALTPQASLQDAHEFSDATIVVRWSQLPRDNAFAVDPATTDLFHDTQLRRR